MANTANVPVKRNINGLCYVANEADVYLSVKVN